MHWGHSKGTCARNFQFLTPPPPTFIPVCFTCTPPPQCTFTLVSYPPPHIKRSSTMLMMLFSNKKLGVKREKRREKN